MSKIIAKKVEELIEPVINELNYDLLGAKFFPAGKRSILRIYIDKKNGVTLDDCSKATHKINYVLDAQNIVNSPFLLEVSSPGVNRPLFTIKHFQQFIGEEIKVKFHKQKDNQTNYVGIIDSVDLLEETFNLKVDEQVLKIHLDEINKANLIYRN